MDERPAQPPEGKLISEALIRRGMSIRTAAAIAGISYGRWRQVTSGYQNASAGSYAAVRAPARTLAKMAAAAGVSPEELARAGREDAAIILRDEPDLLEGLRDAAVDAAVSALRAIPGLTAEERRFTDAFADFVRARRANGERKEGNG